MTGVQTCALPISIWLTRTPQEISKDTKFEYDLLKTNENTSPQSHLILYTLVWWWRGREGGTGPCSHHTSVCKISQLCGAISSLAINVSPSNLVSFLILRPSFQQCQWIFANWSWKSLLCRGLFSAL